MVGPLGIGVRIASVTGALLLVMMWLAALWPAHNPYLDDHLICAFVLIGVYATDAGQCLGFGRNWSGSSLMSKHRFLA